MHKNIHVKFGKNENKKIINSGIDLMKFGWVGKVMKQTGLTKRKLEDTI